MNPSALQQALSSVNNSGNRPGEVAMNPMMAMMAGTGGNGQNLTTSSDFSQSPISQALSGGNNAAPNGQMAPAGAIASNGQYQAQNPAIGQVSPQDMAGFHNVVHSVIQDQQGQQNPFANMMRMLDTVFHGQSQSGQQGPGQQSQGQPRQPGQLMPGQQGMPQGGGIAPAAPISMPQMNNYGEPSMAGR